MVPAARAAMHAASTQFVNLTELIEAAGARIAELTGAPWGIVTSGGSAALCQAAAAALAGADPEKMLRLPDTSGMRRRIIMKRSGRFTYDHALRMVGAEIIEVETLAELESALDGGAAMVCLLGKNEAYGPLRLEVISQRAENRDVPVLVDAAAEHLRRPEPYLARGATMVAYSGGKYLRGPQASGLLLGERGWVEAAWRNGAPHHAFGRPLKVGKEEIAALIAALEYWALERDQVEECINWRKDLDTIAGLVKRIPEVDTEIVESADPTQAVPRLQLCWGKVPVALHGLELRETLLNAQPRIMLDDRGATASSIFIDPFSLQPGEAEIVGEQIHDAIAAAATVRYEATPESPPDHRNNRIDGHWDVHIAFCRGDTEHVFTLSQSGNIVQGTHALTRDQCSIKGTVRGDRIELHSRYPFEGTNLAYTFHGRIEGETMSGRVLLGSTGNSAPGPINEREYGEARWKAIRST